jgi:hypothetical protein
MHLFRFTRTHTLAAVLVAASASIACSSSSDAPTDPIGRGQQAIQSHECTKCHEPTDGAGALAGQTTPQPGTKSYGANLTPDSETGIGDWTDDQILTAILTGVDDEDSPLCKPMPHFGGQGMTEAEARDIIAYLRSLPPVKHTIPESDCPEKAAAPGGDTAGDGGADKAAGKAGN